MAYLDSTGLTTFWNKIKANFGASLGKDSTSARLQLQIKNKATTPATLGTVDITKSDITALGIPSSDTDHNQTVTAGSVTFGVDSAVNFKAGNNVSISASDSDNEISIAASDTTYESKSAASGGTDVSLCTTGEKYTWNNKSSTDTKNTAGSTDSSSKLFLVGATSQAANPQTYSHDTAYVGTDGCLYSGGSKTLTSHQDISGKENSSNKVTAWQSTPDDTHYPSEKLVKDYVDTAVAGGAAYQGTLANETALTALTSYKQGWYWLASASWTSASLGITVDAGNMIICKTAASTYAAANFNVIQADIDAIPDSVIEALS